jgi:hypothetical protein
LACKPEEVKESDSTAALDDSGSTEQDDSGEPQGNPDEYAFLEGKSYAINLADATITKPPGVGSILLTLVTVPVILLEVTSVGASLEMMGAMADESGTAQNYCSASFDFPPADFSGAPAFTAGPTDFSFTVQGSTLILHNLSIAGTFAVDGSYYDHGTLEAIIDLREVEAGFPDLGYTADQLCELVAGFGAPCEPCTDTELYCLTLAAESIVAAEMALDLEEVTADDCAGCETGEPVCE